MKTSLTDLHTIELYLLDKLPAEERLVFEARLLTDAVFRINVACQKKVYSILHYYHRKKIKDQAEQCHRQLFSDPMKKEFQQRILNLFNT